MREIRILAFADLHSPERFSLPDDGLGFDVVALLGDIPPPLVDRILHFAANRPCVGVPGNHDTGPIRGITDVHRRAVHVHGIRFGSFGGARRYEDAPFHYTEAQVARAMLLMPRVDVFLSHAPPLATSRHEDRLHRGFGAFDRYLQWRPPAWWLHGHLSRDSTDVVGETTVCGVREKRLVRIRLP